MANSDGFIDSLKQQKLPSHQCSFGPIFVFCLTFFLGIFCVGVGMIFTNAASQINEKSEDYSFYNENITVEFYWNLTGFNGSVFIYYQLENFNQLHLAMRNSYDYKHFAEADYSYICTGETDEHRNFRDKWPNISSIFGYFIPENRDVYQTKKDRNEEPKRENYTAPVPCGQRANLFFNDTVTVFDEEDHEVPFTNNDISRKYFPKFTPQVESKLFKNPDGYNPSDPCALFIDTNHTNDYYFKPINWNQHICNLTNAMENEDFIVWMTPAYATTFRKLWKRLDLKFTWTTGNNKMSPKNYTGGLPDGIYKIVIKNKWKIPTNSYGEPLYRKKIVITTMNWAGGKKNFFGIAYLVVGIIILFIGCGLAIAQSFNPSYLREQNIERIRWRKNA